MSQFLTSSLPIPFPVPNPVPKPTSLFLEVRALFIEKLQNHFFSEIHHDPWRNAGEGG